MRTTKRILVATLAVTLLASCATTRERRDVETSGFLGDYSMLEEGSGDQVLLVYVADGADFASYDSVRIDPIVIYTTEGTKKLTDEEGQKLASLLHHHLVAELGADYEIVEEAGPGVLRLRSAITQARGAKVVSNTVTSIVPQARLLSTAAGMATDTSALTASAAVEMELLDSNSGRRLAAAVDARAGTKSWRGLGGEWKQVDLAFEYWARKLRVRLAELRAEHAG